MYKWCVLSPGSDKSDLQYEHVAATNWFILLKHKLKLSSDAAAVCGWPHWSALENQHLGQLGLL